MAILADPVLADHAARGAVPGGERRWFRNLSLLALMFSAFSVGYAMRNPWSHPWILDAMERLGYYPLKR